MIKFVICFYVIDKFKVWIKLVLFFCRYKCILFCIVFFNLCIVEIGKFCIERLCNYLVIFFLIVNVVINFIKCWLVKFFLFK